MYRQNRIVAVVMFAFFAAMLYTGMRFRDVAKIMPVFVSSLGMLCSAMLFISVCIKQLRGKPVSAAKAYPRREALQLILAFALIAAYCVLMKPVGFIISSIVFFFLFSLLFGKKESVWRYLVFSVVVTMVIYLAFAVTLHTSFPAGILKGIL